METLPVELVGVILSHVNRVTLPCCLAVCHGWTAALRHHRYHFARAGDHWPRETTVGSLLMRGG
jgi:hypothetical protein